MSIVQIKDINDYVAHESNKKPLISTLYFEQVIECSLNERDKNCINYRYELINS